MKQITNHIKLGVFVLAGLLTLILTLYMIGRNQNLFGSNFELRARFKNVSGLTKGNNIRFSGIQVGTVKKVEIINDTTIEVTMLIDEKVKKYIHRNAIAAIGTEGLMGNKIVNITPARESGVPVEEGDMLSTKKIIDTDEMLQTLYKTNNNIAEISEDLKSTVQRINNSTALWGILNETSLATNLRSSLNDISKASASAKLMMSDLHEIINDVKNGKGSVGSLLTDTTLAVNLNEAVVKIKSVGDQANLLANDLNDLVRGLKNDVNNGKGTVNALLKDSAIVMKLNNSLDNIEKGTAGFNDNMNAIKNSFLFRGYFRRLERQKQKEEQQKKAVAPK